MPRGKLLAHLGTLGSRDGTGRSVPDRGRCAECEKAIYATEDDALRARYEFSTISSFRPPTSYCAYPCPAGNGWHISDHRN